MFRRNWPAILLALAPVTALSMTTTTPISRSAILEQRETHFSGSAEARCAIRECSARQLASVV